MILDPILIVDDEPDFRIPLRDALSADGYTVEDAENANTALSMVERKHYPVILTDLHMPGGPSGLDLIAAVKGRDPKALCVVITGYASLDVTVEAIKRGAYDFVQKPFKLIEIEAVLDRALEHARLLAQLESYRKDLEGRVVSRVKTLKTFHEEALALNALLMEAQCEADEKRLVVPFICYLEERFAPDGYAILLPSGAGWELLLRKGERPWSAVGSLPAADQLTQNLEWGWSGGYPDGYLIPLKKGDEILAALFLGYEKRSSFDPDDPGFVLLKVQMQAAFHGLRCARVLAGTEIRKTQGES
jgi:FixJ family two-component response regulator